MYHARPAFERFQRQSKQIGTLQSKLPDGRWTSNRIKRIYDDRSRKRDHSRGAAVKHAAEWLLERNVDTVYVGNLTDVLETHWSAEVNEKPTRSGVTVDSSNGPGNNDGFDPGTPGGGASDDETGGEGSNIETDVTHVVIG